MRGWFSRIRLGGFASATVTRANALVALVYAFILNQVRFLIGGVFAVECYGPDGVLKWTARAKNGVTDAGIAHILNVYFRSTTQVTTWYLGLIDNSGFTALAAADTAASHAGWSEAAGTNYSNSNRPTWSPGAPSSGAIVNGTTADFAITAGSTLTVKGLFVISDNTKAGTTGTLFATAAFTGGNQAVNSGDTLKVTYTVSAASN